MFDKLKSILGLTKKVTEFSIDLNNIDAIVEIINREIDKYDDDFSIDIIMNINTETPLPQHVVDMITEKTNELSGKNTGNNND